MKASLEEASAAAAKLLQLCSTLCDPRDGSHQAPLSVGFSRQEHWSGLPFPSPIHEKKSESYLSTNFHSNNILKINARALGNVSKVSAYAKSHERKKLDLAVFTRRLEGRISKYESNSGEQR